ncbi:hypothetical protein BGW38_009218, partial [Lunasporangiospora selenospora]
MSPGPFRPDLESTGHTLSEDSATDGDHSAVTRSPSDTDHHHSIGHELTADIPEDEGEAVATCITKAKRTYPMQRPLNTENQYEISGRLDSTCPDNACPDNDSSGNDSSGKDGDSVSSIDTRQDQPTQADDCESVEEANDLYKGVAAEDIVDGEVSHSKGRPISRR